MSSAEAVARAYDAVAPDYDRQVAGDAWMRRILWEHYLTRFRPGQRVLDVSCGTGTDALFLAQHGVRVVAIDLSPEMIRRLRAKVAAAGRSDLIEAQVLDFAELGTWPDEQFDGIVSAFAGLNGVPDLQPFAASAARLLRPQGHLIVHLLNRWSFWEWLGLLARRRWSEASGLGRRRERVFAVGGVKIHQYPFMLGEAYRDFFAPGFRLERAYGLGILRPPHTQRRLPMPLVQALESLERPLRGLPVARGCGRFFVLDLQIKRRGVSERAG